MELKLRIFLIVIILLYLIIIVDMLRKKRINLKYSLIWLFTGTVLMVMCLIPQIIFFATRIVGIATPVNIVFVLEGVFVLVVLLSLTIIVSGQNARIRSLVQYCALLDERIRALEAEKREKDES